MSSRIWWPETRLHPSRNASVQLVQGIARASGGGDDGFQPGSSYTTLFPRNERVWRLYPEAKKASKQRGGPWKGGPGAAPAAGFFHVCHTVPKAVERVGVSIVESPSAMDATAPSSSSTDDPPPGDDSILRSRLAS